MIDLVIPTMWVNELGVLKRIESYTKSPLVSKVIVVSNSKRPVSAILVHQKVAIIDYGRNIFVNPAWNEGYLKSTSKILGLVNDDIDIHDDVFKMVSGFNFQHGDLLGVDLRGYANNYRIDDFIDTPEEIVPLESFDRTKDIGGQAWAFGICMFMPRSSYKPIPSLFQIWYGDDYLVQHAKRIFVLRTNKIKGVISETLVKHDQPHSSIRKRRELDTRNYAKYRFQLEYEAHKALQSDISEHLEVLYHLANQCSHVTEFGVRFGSSTRAFLASSANKIVSYDLQLDPGVNNLFNKAKELGRSAKYIQANVLEVQIEQTDLLFIDTLHTYEQLKAELGLHSDKVNKYIVLHDTHTFGTAGELQKDTRGLLPAVIEFCIKNPSWKFALHKTDNNGLTVIEKRKE